MAAKEAIEAISETCNDTLERRVVTAMNENTRKKYFDNTLTEPDTEVAFASFDHFMSLDEMRDGMAELHREHMGTDVRVYTYPESIIGSRSMMGLLGDWGPTVVFAVNRHQGTHLPFREGHMTEFGYSKLCHLTCTLAKGLMFGHADLGVAQSKVYNLRSVATIMHQTGLIIPEEDLNENNYQQIIFDVALTVQKLLAKVKMTELEGETVVKQAESHNLGYVEELNAMFPDRIRGILLYGSSARGCGTDYDNIIVLDELKPSDFELINQHPIYENGKEVGCIFISDDIADQFFYVNVSNIIFRNQGKVLQGEVRFPVDDIGYSKRKEQYHAGFGSAKLVSALNLAFKLPEIFSEEKFGLLEYFVKLNRFTLSGLKMQDQYRILDKERIYDELLEEYDYDLRGILGDRQRLLKACQDPEFVQDLFLNANIVSGEISYRLHNPFKARKGGEEEYLFRTLDRATDGVMVSNFEGVPVYILKKKEHIQKDDVIPVRIYRPEHRKFRKWDRKLRARLSQKREWLPGMTKAPELPEHYIVAQRM